MSENYPALQTSREICALSPERAHARLKAKADRVQVLEPDQIKRPKFVWLKPCKNCPTAHFELDDEAKMYASLPTLYRRMRHAFACGWRPKGYCAANYKLQYKGLNHDHL